MGKYWDENSKALWNFAGEWIGNLKSLTEEGMMTIGELEELAELYPEIWGEYVRSHPQTKGQELDTGIQTELQPDPVGTEGFIEPDFGWLTGAIGADTFGGGL